MIALKILKIAGIVLGAIVALILLIILLVLFVPLRYKLSGKGKNEDFTFNGAVKWLLGLLSANIRYQGKCINYYLRIAGIKIFKGEFDLEALSGDDSITPEAEKDLSGEHEGNTYNTAQSAPYAARTEGSGAASGNATLYDKSDYPGQKKFEKQQKADAKENAQSVKQSHKVGEKKPNKSEKKSFQERIDSFLEKIRSTWNKIKNIWDKVQKVKYILEAPVTKRAFAYLKAQLFKLLGHIRPRVMKGNIHFGFEDPARTAEIYGVASCVCAAIDRRLMIVPEMDNQLFAADVVIKGRIFIGYVLLLGLKIITNKDIRRVIRYTRKNLLTPDHKTDKTEKHSENNNAA